MASVKPTDIVDDVEAVLSKAAKCKGERSYMTAYQILDRLPVQARRQLISEKRIGGRNAGVEFAAAGAVATAARMLDAKVQSIWLDTGGSRFDVGGQGIPPGARVCKLFRLKD